MIRIRSAILTLAISAVQLNLHQCSADTKCQFSSSIENSICTGVIDPKSPTADRILYPGEFVCSTNKQYQFGLTNSGAVVLCNGNHEVWSPSEDSDTIASFAIFQTGGNMVAYYFDSDNYEIVWETKTWQQRNAKFFLDNDGSMMITNFIGGVVWKVEAKPNFQPSFETPTINPNAEPSIFPSRKPSPLLSMQPSIKQTDSPSFQPSFYPTSISSSYPTVNISTQPSISDTSEPSIYNSITPSSTPSFSSSNPPTIASSLSPSLHPTSDMPDCTFSTSVDDQDCSGSISSKMPTSDRFFFRGEFICSPNKAYQFGLTLKGSLAICKRGILEWSAFSTDDERVTADFFILQPEGDLLAYSKPENNPTYKLEWETQTGDGNHVALSLSNDGILTMTNSLDVIIWGAPEYSMFPSFLTTKSPSSQPTIRNTIQPSPIPTQSPTLTPTSSPTLTPTLKPTSKPTLHLSMEPSIEKPEDYCHFSSLGDDVICHDILTPDMRRKDRQFFAGERMCSSNGEYFFGVTKNNFVAICQGDKMVWKEGPFLGFPNLNMIFQRDGKLVLYSTTNPSAPEFQVLYTSTTRTAFSTLNLLDSGVLVIKTPEDEVIWNPVVGVITQSPTLTPTSSPTLTPTLKPSSKPTLSPTLTPTSKPTLYLSMEPSIEKPEDYCQFSSGENTDCYNTLTPDMPHEDRQFFAGERMCSSSGEYFFGVTTNNFLAICQGNQMIRKEGPFIGFPKLNLVFQPDGNLVLYSTTNPSAPEFQVLFTSRTHVASSSLNLLDSGILVIKTPEDEVIWNSIVGPINSNPNPDPISTETSVQEEVPLSPMFSPSGSSEDSCGFVVDDPEIVCDGTLTSDMSHRMYSGQFICTNREFYFGMTKDSHLAVCHYNKKVWSVGPFNGPMPFVNFQKDGNLVVYSGTDNTSPDFQALFSTKTSGNPSSTLKLHQNGVVDIINSSGLVIWRARPEVTQSSTINSPIDSSYHPGKLVYHPFLGLYLSEGLSGRVIARTGKAVRYKNNRRSSVKFHEKPDAAACFPSSDGGWYYMSNSEVGDRQDADGGVGKITFDPSGDVIDYKMVLAETRMNCGSGKTPWGTFISCEEIKPKEGANNGGRCYEVHPEDKWPARPTQFGGVRGDKFESAAFDSRNMKNLKAYITVDSSTGPLHRFTPDSPTLQTALATGDFSQVLHREGTTHYLVLIPEEGRFRWTTRRWEAEESAELYYPNLEGVDFHEGKLYVVSKIFREMFVLDVDNMTYESSSTSSGAFDGQPDQIKFLLPKDKSHENNQLLYFLEEGGDTKAGVYARDGSTGSFVTIVEGGPDSNGETSGLAFCDNGRRMMFAFQEEGKVFEIMRDDGQPLYGSTVNVKYHNS